MRDLIDARVTLINVARALHTSADGIHEDLRAPLRHAVDCMSGFLGDVIDEFRHSYKPIADMQRVYEADMTAHTDTAPSERDTEPPANPAWNRIRGLNMYSTLIRSPIDSRPPPAYQLRFIEPLDYASSTLRDQLTAVLTGHRAKSQPRRRRKNRGRRGTSEPSRTGDTDTIQWGFHVWATFDLRDGYWLRFVEAAIANFDGSTANEEGTIDLAAIPDPYLSGRWYLHEVYTSAEAFQFHTQGPYYRTFFSRIESGYDRPYDDTSGRCLRSSWNPERPEAEPTTPGFTLGPKALARLLVRPKDSDPPQELPM
jgi:quinol monooxygenase YgiN